MVKQADVAAITQESDLGQLIKLDTVPWYKKPNLRLLYLCLIPAALGVEMTTGYDGSIMNGLQAVEAWQDYFHHPHGAILGVLNAAYNLGGVISLPIVPFVNDKIGRKHSITFGAGILVIGVILQTLSRNIAMFLVSRFVLGTGIPFCVSGAAQLIAELGNPRHTSVLNGLFNASWSVGAIMAAGVTLGTYSRKDDWSWRIPSLLQISPSLLQLIFIWFIPESPRWLVSKDRNEEAFDILVKYHGEGDRQNALVNAEFVEIQNRVRFEMENSKRRWVELLQTSGNRKRALISACIGLFSQWSGNGLVSYYLAKILTSIGIEDRRTQNLINLSLSCWNLVTQVICSFFTRFIGRRKQYLTSFVCMTIMFTIWTAVSAHYTETGDGAAAKAVIAMIFLYYASYNLMFPLSYVYTTEVYPFVHRAKGVALTQFFTRGATAFNAFVNPIGLDSIHWKFYLVYVVWLPIETTIIYFLYPETRGPTLEELADLFNEEKDYEMKAKHVDA